MIFFLIKFMLASSSVIANWVTPELLLQKNSHKGSIFSKSLLQNSNGFEKRFI